MKELLKDKHFLFVTRIFAIMNAVFFLATAFIIPIKQIFSTSNNICCFFGNITIFIFALLHAIYPEKTRFLTIPSLIYGISCTLFDPKNPLGMFMLILGSASLYTRGFFKKNSSKKITVFIIIYLILFFIGIRLSKDFILSDLIQKISLIMIFLFSAFIVTNRKTKEMTDSTRKKLNLAAYSKLSKNDAVMLQKVLENKQYKQIASEVFRSEGFVRNRLNFIYDILEVSDKADFIFKYTNFEIVFSREQH